MQVLYTAQATATGGRNGKVESSDGVVKLDLTMPKSLGGAETPGNAANMGRTRNSAIS